MSKYSIELVNQHYPGALMIEAQKYWSPLEKHKYLIPERVDNGKYFAQLKKDGNWYMYVKGYNGETYLFSRNESVKTKLLTEKSGHVPHIIKALENLPNKTILLGEIYQPGGDSNDTGRIMRCLEDEAVRRQEENGYIHFYIFDCLSFDGEMLLDVGAWDRWLKTKEIYNDYSFGNYNFLELAETITENIYETALDYLAKGEEGMVAKLLTAPYTPGKKPAWSSIKIKKEDSADLVCMGYEDPTKEYEGKEINTWDYWLIEKYDSELEVWTEYERTREQKCVKGIGFRTIAVTKSYYYGWAGSMRIGAYDENNNLVEVGTVSSGLTDLVKAELVTNTNKYVGKVVKIDMMEKFEGTIRQPVYRGLHDDKNAFECTLQEIFNK